MMPVLPATPKWFICILGALCAPVLAMPWLLNAPFAAQPGVKVFVWLYPAYVVVAAWLAWLCYPGRRAVAWILAILMLLSHCAIWILVMNGIH